jgi:hypothetical protein
MPLQRYRDTLQDTQTRARRDHLEALALLGAAFTASTAATTLGIIVAFWLMGVVP